MKKSLLALSIFLIIIMGVFAIRTINYTGSSEAPVPQASEENKVGVEQTEKAENISEEEIISDEGKISLSQLEKHNNQNDCWIAYKGKVYDITSYIPRHPGGEDKIARNCGTAEKFEQEFTTKHGTSKVSTLMKVGTFIGDFDLIGELS